MNKSILMGRLTADPENRVTESGMSVTRWTTAVDRKKSKDGKKEADFIRCIAFDKTADVVSKYFKKGQMIALVGHISTGSYTNKEGKKVYTTDVVADEVHFCGKKDDAPVETPSDFEPIEPGNEEELPFS